MINVIMRNIRLLTMTLLIGSLVSCGPVQKSQKEERSSVRTSETENLLANLKKYHPGALCSDIMMILITV